MDKNSVHSTDYNISSTRFVEFLENMNIKMLKKSQRAEFLPDFQNVCTKIFQNDTSFKKKLSKNFWVGLSVREKTKKPKF